MRRWMVAPLVFAAAIGLTTLEPRPAVAQPPGPAAETFRTADGVELHGMFHATNKTPASAPVVVFLYPPGPDRDLTKGKWGDLAKALNAEGYHVFQFDWRGHGKSTTIKDKAKFWQNPYLNGPNSNFNRAIKGGPPAMPLKNDLFYKDLGQPQNANKYLPAYLNDLAAVRLHLDTKNDAKELNTSTIYVVGAGDAAGLGMAWMTTEWNRPATKPDISQLGVNAVGYEFVPQALRGNFDEAGADFGGAVWLTATRPSAISQPTVKGWVSGKAVNGTASAPKLRDNTPMLFLHADKDKVGKEQSEFYFKEVLVADPVRAKIAKLEVPDQTFLREVKDAQKLEGLNLLGTPLKVEDTIVEYFKAIQKVRQKYQSKTRDFKAPYYISLPSFDLRP